MPVPDRNSTVDTLRTAALIGICVVNLPFMGLPQGVVLSAPDGLWNQAAALFTGIFFEAKFFMLFSFLFGWGIEIQQRSAERAGASAGRRYGRRLVMLALFGVAHAIFVFSGDILVLYALLGLLIWPFRRARPGVLASIAAGMVVLSCLSLTWLTTLLPSEAASVPAGPGLGGSYGEAVLARLADWPETLVFLIILQGPLAFCAYAAGLAAAKTGFFEPGLPWRRHCAHALPWLLMAGLPINIAYGYVANGPGFGGDGLADLVSFISLGLGAPVLAAAYLCIIRLVFERPRLPQILVLAGRNSLSAYVLQGVIAGFLFGVYGLGLFGQLGHAAFLPMSVVVALTAMLAVGLCARLFGRGPLEAVLRRVTYGAPARRVGGEGAKP